MDTSSAFVVVVDNVNQSVITYLVEKLATLNETEFILEINKREIGNSLHPWVTTFCNNNFQLRAS